VGNSERSIHILQEYASLRGSRSKYRSRKEVRSQQGSRLGRGCSTGWSCWSIGSDYVDVDVDEWTFRFMYHFLPCLDTSVLSSCQVGGAGHGGMGDG